MKEQIKNILHVISDAALIFDEQGNVVYKNPVFSGLISSKGVSSDSSNHLLQSLWRLCRQHPSDVETTIQHTVDMDLSGKWHANVYLLDTISPASGRYLILFHGSPEADVCIPQAERMTPSSIKLDPAFKLLVGQAPLFKDALVAAQKGASADLPLLIVGESGTGKELLARAIHRVSKRRDKPFMDINCAAIPDNLIESELFGYEHGAFTGADKSGRAGVFEAAHQGTFFMDEIGDASLTTQAKVLRVLQEGVLKRVGGRRNINVDVRVISATNQDLAKMIEEKTFRKDLYYRLNTITIYLPALRERRNDIPLLIRHFMAQHDAGKIHRLKFSDDCLGILMNYHWPGNVRELKSVVEYALIMSEKDLITPENLPSFLASPQIDSHATVNIDSCEFFLQQGDLNLNEAVTSLERELINRALAKASNRSEAIRILGISRRTFYKKMKEYDL